MCFFYATEEWILFLYPIYQPVSFNGELYPFILVDGIDQGLLFPVILVFIVGDIIVCSLPPSLGFAAVRLSIVCVVDVANFPGLEFSFQYFVQGWVCGQVLDEAGSVMEYLVLSIYGD